MSENEKSVQEYLTPVMLAKILGVKVRSVQNWVNAGKLPAIKIGQRMFIEKNWKDAMRVKYK